MLAFTTETPETAQEACLWCDGDKDVQYIHYTLASGRMSMSVEPMCVRCQKFYKEGAFRYLRKN